MAKKRKNFLDCIPVINPKNTWNEQGGKVTINMLNTGIYNSIAQRFFHTPRVSRIDLDKYGSCIWKAIDGRRTVYEIGLIVSESFGDEVNPLFNRLVKYMQVLRNNKFILFCNRDIKESKI